MEGGQLNDTLVEGTNVDWCFQCQWSVKKQLKIWLPFIQPGRALNKYAHGSKVLDRLAAMRKIDA